MKNKLVNTITPTLLCCSIVIPALVHAASLAITPRQIPDLDQYQTLVNQATETAVEEVKKEWSGAIFSLRFRPYDLINFDPLSAFGTTQSPSNDLSDDSSFSEAADKVEDTMPSVFR